MEKPACLTHPLSLALCLLLSLSSPPAHAAVGWLATSGNHIINPDGTVWIGRGANLHDTRSCGGGFLGDNSPINDSAIGVGEVKRRIDVLTDVWKASFIRLALETRRPQDNYLNDLNYRGKIKEIVDYIGTKPGVYVLVSLWQDPSFEPDGTTGGWPTAATNAILAQLATDFYASPHVLYGVSNEPQENWGGAQDAQVWTRMDNAVAAIRAAENLLGGAYHHIVTVQGTRDWAREVSYYDTHHIAAGGGANVAYETHIYNSPADFASLLLAAPHPPRTIPVILGEFGPIRWDGYHLATVPDMQTLIDLATANDIPYLAWTFHQYCSPNLIADAPNVVWDTQTTRPDWIGMPIFPTDFGQLLKTNLLAAAPALLNTSIAYAVTSTNDNVTRAGTTAQVTRLNNLGAEKRPVVVLMPGWGGVGDVAASQDAQAIMFANQGYVALNIGFHQTSDTAGGALAAWYSDLSESAKGALETLCVETYADCSAVVLVGESYGGTQTHPVLRYLRDGGGFDGANAARKVIGMLGQDSGYTLSWSGPADADATAYSIAMIQNLGDGDFPVDSCDFGNCGARNRADYHRTVAGSQFVLSYCPAGGSHGSRGYADWDAWVLSAVKTMLHTHRGVAKFTGYVEPALAVSNACTTVPLPTAATGAATGVGLTGATLNGTANPNGSSTTAVFDYGPTASYGTRVAAAPLPGAGSSPVSVSASITGLTCSAIYHFRVVATSGVGTANGADATFTTSPCQTSLAPIVTTGAATNVVAAGATLNGTVNPNGTSTTALFQYGLSTSYGTQAAASPAPGSGVSPQSVSAAITGLTCSTTYHFRLVATSVGGGTTNGSDGTFATPICQGLSINDPSIAEGGSGKSILAFTLSLSQASTSAVTVDYTTGNGTATAGSDYTAATGTFTIPAGSTSKQLTILVEGDSTVESDETLTLTLSNATGVTIGKSIGTGTIVNDDPPVAATTVTQYRLYNDFTKEHLYTTDLNEYTVLGTRGWIQEGIAYKMLTNGLYNGVATVPLFRMYHPGILQHHWTTDSNEAVTITRTPFWFYEATIGYLLPTQVSGTVPLYRMALANPALHLWTTDFNEYTVLQTLGWIPEGIIGYVVP